MFASALAVLGFAASAIPTTPCAGHVWVVDDDGGPGVDFTEVQPAIDLAADGDVILVRDGSYPAATIDGRSITVVADAGADVTMSGLEIKGTPANGAVVVRGVSLHALEAPGARIEGNAGLVWLEDVDAYGKPAVEVLGGNADVVAIRCFVHGGPGTYPGPFGGPVFTPGTGMRAVSDSTDPLTNLHLQETIVQGGGGAAGYDPSLGEHDTQIGAVGLFAGGGPTQIVAAGCEFSGGSGGDGFYIYGTVPFVPIGCESGSPGGTGFQTQGSLIELDCTFVGGEGGTAPEECSDAPDGVAKIVEGGNLALSGPSRTYEVSGPVREGQPLVLDFQGLPGDLAYLLFNVQADPFYLGPCQGTVLPSLGGMLVVFLGAVDATGALTVTVPAPTLPSGIESLVAFTQANLVSPDVACHATTGSAFVLLDSSF